MKRTAIKRTGAPKRKPRKRYDPEKAQEFWYEVCHWPRLERPQEITIKKGHATGSALGFHGATPRRRRPCAVCGHTSVDAHHILPKQFIYSECKTARVRPDDYLWDVRNGLPLCRPCHDAHEGGSERLSRVLVSQPAWAFIASIDHLSGTGRATLKIMALYPC